MLKVLFMNTKKNYEFNRNSFPKVAVLLAAYNGMKWIKEQINSILYQKNVNIDIYISVDSSDDGTYEWCLNLAKNNNNINVLSYGIRYGGAGKNFFRLIKDVDFTNYDYISFADQDDIWMLDKLSHGIKQMKINKAKAYSANVIAFWEDGNEKIIDKSQPQRKLDYLFEGGGPGCTYIFSIEPANLVKHYLTIFSELNDFYFHDWLFYAILRHNKFNWFIDSVPKMKYRQHMDNHVGANILIKSKLFRIRYVLSGKVFKYINLLIVFLKIKNIAIYEVYICR